MSEMVERVALRLGETRDKPWMTAGMSQRTWYRRQAEQKESK